LILYQPEAYQYIHSQDASEGGYFVM